MIIRTSKNREYNAKWADTPVQDENRLVMQIADGRKIGEIAPEFEGLEMVKRLDSAEGDKTFTGYTWLERIARVGGGVQIALRRDSE